MKGIPLPGKWGELLKRNRAVLLVLAVGLALLIWPQGGAQTENEAAQRTDSAAASDTLFQTEELERRLSGALAQVRGVGQCTVVFTLESSAEQVLAVNRDGEEEEIVVVSSGSGGEQAVTVRQIGPQLQGVLVVCDGGGDPQVKLQVLQAVEALTGLNANQISICEGTGGS